MVTANYCIVNCRPSNTPVSMDLQRSVHCCLQQIYIIPIYLNSSDFTMTYTVLLCLNRQGSFSEPLSAVISWPHWCFNLKLKTIPKWEIITLVACSKGLMNVFLTRTSCCKVRNDIPLSEAVDAADRSTRSLSYLWKQYIFSYDRQVYSSLCQFEKFHQPLVATVFTLNVGIELVCIQAVWQRWSTFWTLKHVNISQYRQNIQIWT